MSTNDLETWPFLVFSRGTEVGEAINALLRNRGILSEIRYINSSKALAQESPGDWSLLLWDPEEELTWSELPLELRERWSLVPCISMFAKAPADPPQGIWISLDEPERTRQTLEREHRLSRLTRERTRLLFEIDEINRNTRLVFDTLETAAAFIQDGLYLYANRAYLESFGLKTWEGGSFLEAIAAPDRARVKQALKAVLQSAEQKIHDLKAIPMGGDSAVKLSLRATTFGSEPAILVIRHPPEIRVPAPPPPTESPRPLPQPVTIPTGGVLDPVDFLARIEEQLEATRPKHSEQAMVVACIENPSSLIEEHGPFIIHAACGLVERKIAPLLAPTDLCTRVGWELCFWIERPRDGTLENWVKDIQASTSNQIYDVLGKSILLNLKFGISERISRSSPRALTREAKEAATGPNPVNRYQPDNLSGNRSDDIASALARMIERKTLPLVARPIQSLSGKDNRTRLELRLNPSLLKTYRLNGWADFFTLAFDSDNLAGLEMLLIEMALGFPNRHGTAQETTLFLRLSGLALVTPEAQARLVGSLPKISGFKLVFLFDERSVAGQLRKTQEWIARFKPAGIQIGLDGFGESAHSAILLNHVRPDLVRIPVTHLVTPDDPDRAETEAPPPPPAHTRLLGPLKSHGVEILASGVDQARLMTPLLNLGISLVQGPLVGEDAPLT